MTGEQPAAKAETPLSESTPIRIGLVAVLLGAAVSVGGLYFKVESLQERMTKGETEREALKTAQTALLVRVTVAESSFAEIKESLKELKAMVAEIRGGTRYVNDRQPREPGR